MKIKICLICKERFEVKFPSNKRKYCSYFCAQQRTVSDETREKMSAAKQGKNHPLFGKRHSKETRKKMSASRKGNTPWNKGRKEIRAFVLNSMSLTKKELYKDNPQLLDYLRGESHPRWKGGKTTEKARKTFYHRRYLTSKYHNGGKHSLSDWESLKAKYGYMCLCCKRSEPEIHLTEDHILPISRGGSDDISNIQPLCRRCNSCKFTKTINYQPLALIA